MDNTFKVLRFSDRRSEQYEAYRAEWWRRGDELDPGEVPLHLDIETTATCDLRCGGENSFCNVWTHEAIRKEGLQNKRAFKPGFMNEADFYKLVNDAKDSGVRSIKLNFRGEPTLHPYIDEFVWKAALEGFADISMNTNGNGGARKDPELFNKIVKNGIINLMFSADACTEDIYTKQRVGGKWNLLLNSVRSAVLARDMGFGNPDCRIRVSAVRTKLNKDQIDSGQFEEFWVDKIGVDWASISECYFPAGTSHEWQAAAWKQMEPHEFQCEDPFRRMVVTWDLESTLPCCQGFTKEVNGGDVLLRSIKHAWKSKPFVDLRALHRQQQWDVEPMCLACPLTRRVIAND